MSLSNATITPALMELTPMRVTYDGVDLGGTLEGVTVSIETDKAEIKADQFGTSPLDKRATGLKVTVKTTLSEIQLKDNVKVLFPHQSLITSGPNKAMYFTNPVGASDIAVAKVLVLHPLSKADADKSGDFKCYLACADEKIEAKFTADKQVGYAVTWTIYPDTSVVPARYLFMGDPTIGLVAATAGSPVLTGTGNGTMTGVSVFSGTTVTETITATCVTAVANGGVFNVNGSVSGPLGLATVGVAFVTSKIAFTINDGSTDFIVGDAFTVATTAANYA